MIGPIERLAVLADSTDTGPLTVDAATPGVVGDFNGDGKPDLLSTNVEGVGHIAVMLNTSQ